MGGRPGQQLFAKHKFTTAKQREFVGCPTATLLKHDVVTGATMMFRASIRRYCSPIPASWVHDGWLAWMIALHSRLGLVAEPLIDYRIHAGQQLGVSSAVRPQSGTATAKRGGSFTSESRASLKTCCSACWPRAGVRTMRCSGRSARRSTFLRRQSTLSPSLGVRTLQMIGQLPRYVHYARGLGSLRNDLLLGRETP